MITLVYERRHHPPLLFRQFLARLMVHAIVATMVLGGSLGLGMWGYAHYEGLGWRDAYLNAAMLLGGMGPVEDPQTPGGKLFAGTYALYAGMIFLVSVGIVFTPVVHRLLHRFHWEAKGDDRRQNR